MRSPIKTQLAAVGVSPWLPLDYHQRGFAVGLYAGLSEDASAGATYSVEYTPDNPNDSRATRNNVVSLTRSGTTATLTFTNPHGLVAGDSAVVVNSGDPNLDGNQTVVAASSPTVITYTVANTGLTVALAAVQAVACRVFAAATALTAATTRQSALVQQPMMAVRLHVTAITAGFVLLEVVQGLARG